MGQQQLLLILLGVLIVGLGIFLGVVLFKEFSVGSNRDYIIHEVLNLSAMAHKYYSTPSMLGGGSNKFTGWRIPYGLKKTTNGSYVLESVSDTNLIIIATGNEIVTGTDSVKVRITISPKKYQVEIIH